MNSPERHNTEPEFYIWLTGEPLKFLKQRRSDLGGGGGEGIFCCNAETDSSKSDRNRQASWGRSDH